MAERVAALKVRVRELVERATSAEAEFRPHLYAVRPEHHRSALNLVNDVWLRGPDIRGPQSERTDLGLSSLGPLESHAVPTLEGPGPQPEPHGRYG